MSSGVSGDSTAAGPSGGRKRKGETPTEGFGIGSTVVRPKSRQVLELVDQCCSCTQDLTCSTTGPSDCACECHNAVRQCSGCYCWGRCKNWGRLMPSPITTRGLIGHFPRGVDPPTTDQRATTPPVRLPISSSLWAILVAGSVGRGTRSGASSRKGLREGGDKSAG